MTPDQAITQAKRGELQPVYLITGEEVLLRDRVVRALRDAVTAGGIAGLNDDQFVAGEADVGEILGIARTMPMMARQRAVLVRAIERWESGGKKQGGAALDRLAEYAKAPAPETVLMLVASKLDKRRRLVAQARKGGWLVACDALSRQELPRWAEAHARSSGGQLAPGVGELIAELVGPELSPVADAVERICLFAGDREATEDDVAECLVKLRTKTVWELVDAVALRDLSGALAALDAVFDPREAGRLVGLLAWSTRQLIKFEAALSEGAAAPEAARRAGAPPFKARDLTDRVRRTSRARLESWLSTLATVDVAVKGGSRRPGKAVFEHAIMQACASA